MSSSCLDIWYKICTKLIWAEKSLKDFLINIWNIVGILIKNIACKTCCQRLSSFFKINIISTFQIWSLSQHRVQDSEYPLWMNPKANYHKCDKQPLNINQIDGIPSIVSFPCIFQKCLWNGILTNQLLYYNII